MFPNVEAVRYSGDERLRLGDAAGEGAAGASVVDFWRWSSSDLLSNATRGIFAEFIVTYALRGSVEGVRTEWDAFDVLTPEGISQ